MSSFGSIYYPFFGMGGLSGIGSPSSMSQGPPSALGLSSLLAHNATNHPPSPGCSQFIAHLLKAELPPTSSTATATRTGIGEAPTGNADVEQFQDICFKLLFSHVEWLRRVPYFTGLHVSQTNGSPFIITEEHFMY